jgi:hypothetical protein
LCDAEIGVDTAMATNLTRTDMNTKMVVTVLGLATLVATPAFAQKPTHHAANGAYASTVQQPASVASNGYNVGTDPDPSIRFELERDAPTYSMGN